MPPDEAHKVELDTEIIKDWCKNWVKISEAVGVLTEEIESIHDYVHDPDLTGEDAQYYTEWHLDLSEALKTLNKLEAELFDKIIYVVEEALTHKGH
jgi:hypothetical protein